MASELTTSVPTKLPGGKNPTADKLLVAASELMIERSSIEVSLSDIAQKSGVNAALVKYHFGNKEGLLLALLARDAATEVSQLEYLSGAADCADGKTSPAYWRHHPGLSPVPLYEPADPLPPAREHRGSRRRSLEIFRRAVDGLSSPPAGRRHQGRRIPQDRSGPVLHQPDRCLRSSVLRPSGDVARDRRRSGHRRSLPRLHRAHGSADLRRHAERKKRANGE